MIEKQIFAAALPIVLAGGIFGLRFLALAPRREAARREHVPASILAGGLSAIVASISVRLPGTAFAGAMLCLAIIALYEICDYISFRYFRTSLAANLAHLEFGVHGGNGIKHAWTYARLLFPVRYGAAVASTLAASAVLARHEAAPVSPTVATAAALALAAFVLRRRPEAPLARLTQAEKAFVEAGTNVEVQSLRRVDRAGAVRLCDPLGRAPGTILVIINESAGMHLPAAERRDRLLADRIREISGEPGPWFVPSNAVTNSSCTDISIPSILTGSAPHESGAHLHAMPLVFDLAKARGYRTAYFSSSVIKWANFEQFLSGSSVDEFFTAETSGYPYVNDLAVDDIVPARELASRLLEAKEPMLAVIYFCALHVPFQAESECGVPSVLRRRRDRATHITQTAHEVLFDALRACGRYDDALIFSIGDHGEVLGNADDAVEHHMARTTDLHECVVRPLYLMKPPAGLPPAALRSLQVNRDRLVTNLDVAPTVSHLLGAVPRDGLAYAGQSLFKEIPPERIAYLLNTNEWRSWPRGAVGVFRGRSSVAVDYLDAQLCRYLPEPGAPLHEVEDLLQQAYGVELLQRSISRIYRDKLGMADARDPQPRK